MKSKAAIAFSAGEPLSIEGVDLEGPKSGEVLVEVMATEVCRTDAYTLSGGDPEGLFPSILGHEGARLVGADRIIGIDTNPNKEALARRFGLTDFINPENSVDVTTEIMDLTDGRVDYSFECIGKPEVMRQALESCHKGWGENMIIGVAAAGEEISTRAFQLVTGRTWKGTAFGGAKGRSDAPRIVDWCMDGKINIDDLITHQFQLENINEAFDVMHAGEGIRSVVVY